MILTDFSVKPHRIIVEGVKYDPTSYEVKILEEAGKDIPYAIVPKSQTKAQILYNCGNLISMTDYLKTKKLREADLCDIMDSVNNILSNTENYLIPESSICLDTNALCVERDSKTKSLKLYFTIIPNYGSDFSKELSKLLLKLLRHIDTTQKEALALGYALFVKSSKENYTVSDLMEVVDEKRVNVKRTPAKINRYACPMNMKGAFVCYTLPETYLYEADLRKDVEATVVTSIDGVKAHKCEPVCFEKASLVSSKLKINSPGLEKNLNLTTAMRGVVCGVAQKTDNTVDFVIIYDYKDGLRIFTPLQFTHYRKYYKVLNIQNDNSCIKGFEGYPIPTIKKEEK